MTIAPFASADTQCVLPSYIEMNPDDAPAHARFGADIAVFGDYAIFGAPYDITEVSSGGAAYQDLHTPEQTSAVYIHDIRDLSFVGDLNDDGAIDFDDAELFAGVLLGVDADPLHVARADTNCSGAVDGRDLQFFVESLIGD
ncbi:MAG TPA: hypothetical protein P5081_08495 [Phycisphaerae bacterium]|nr:hypothetical protein [Phycisphaerae bacterium]HRW52912.1 hypothetical protein [Phycisphaerae bacterium]